MSREDAIRLEGRVVEVLPNGTFQVELSNGHRLLGHGTRKTREALASLTVGNNVFLDLSPCDFSKGRIVRIESKCCNESSRISEEALRKLQSD